MLIPAIVLVITVWALITIIGRIRRHDKISVIHWAVLFVGLIGIDLWRVLEGYTPALKDSSDLALVLMCSGLVALGPPVALGVYRYIVSKKSADPLQVLANGARGGVAPRIAKACLVVVTAFALIIIYSGSVLLGAAYTYGMSWLPENRYPSGQGLPAQAVQVAWAAEFGSGPMVIEPCFNYDVIRLFLQRQTKGRIPAAIHHWLPAGYHAAHLAARIMSRREPQKIDDQRLRRLKRITAAAWVSRNWTADQAVRTILAESYLGNGCYGLEEASRGYFGCLPSQLTIDEVALIVGLLKSPSRDNPFSNPEHTRQRFAPCCCES